MSCNVGDVLLIARRETLDASRGRQRPEHPVGIQLRRSAGWNLQEASLNLNGLQAVSVARPGFFGNPFLVSDFDAAGAVGLHRRWLLAASADELGYSGKKAADLDARRTRLLAWLPRLRGCNLACWCAAPTVPGAPDVCHRAALIELANGGTAGRG